MKETVARFAGEVELGAIGADEHVQVSQSVLSQVTAVTAGDAQSAIGCCLHHLAAGRPAKRVRKVTHPLE